MTIRRLTEAEQSLFAHEWSSHPEVCEIVDSNLNPVFRVANINGRDIAVCDSAIGRRLQYRWKMAAPLLTECPDDPPDHYNGTRYVTAYDQRRHREENTRDLEIRKWRAWWGHAAQCRDESQLKFELTSAFANRLFD